MFYVDSEFFELVFYNHLFNDQKCLRLLLRIRRKIELKKTYQISYYICQ